MSKRRDSERRDREEQQRKETGRRADELRQSWRDHHPSEEDEARRMREEISRLEEKRRRLSSEVMEGRPSALEEDEQLERRILELARRLEGGKA